MLAWLDRDGALALRLVGRAIELDPGFHGLYSVRANLRAGMGRYDEALADIRRASELSNEAVSPVTVARLEAASGKLEAALVTIDKAEKNKIPTTANILSCVATISFSSVGRRKRRSPIAQPRTWRGNLCLNRTKLPIRGPWFPIRILNLRCC